MGLASLLVGALLLALGRKIYWLFVGALGFAAGLVIASQYLQPAQDWQTLLIALGAGLLGALLANFLQRLALQVAGFVAGALIAGNLFTAFSPAHSLAPTPWWYWALLVAGGILGAALILALFEWGLIAISALVGAWLIVTGLGLADTTALLVGGALFVVGAGLQVALKQRDDRRGRDKKR